ncbi:substance-K receptor [Nephila pilipes]|uniref:Substance-K receptor n=1 Tax=Nephila pilipes TaxID=299642 RepID=A0A8X6MTU5_NEPPI|nr:substance-K receptor [Nephila pilipes]
MFPLHVRITKQRTSIVMQIIWVISILVSVPFLIFKKHEVYKWRDFVEPVCSEIWPKLTYYDEDLGHCKSIEQYRLTYYMVCSITLYFIPIVIMITAYSLILWKLWISEVPGERHAANINVQYRARKKADSWTAEYQWLVTILLFANSFINPIIYGG